MGSGHLQPTISVSPLSLHYNRDGCPSDGLSDSANINKGWYSCYLVFPKKGGLRLILDLRVLQVFKFRMLTVRQLLAAVRPDEDVRRY